MWVHVGRQDSACRRRFPLAGFSQSTARRDARRFVNRAAADVLIAIARCLRRRYLKSFKVLRLFVSGGGEGDGNKLSGLVEGCKLCSR